MFEYLKAEAYTRLREEIRAAIIADFDNEEAGTSEFFSGKMYAYKKILAISSKVHEDLLYALDREAEKEAAYYGSIYEKQ